jgi:hypothetical protein
MAIYRLAASVIERYGTFHVRVVANSHDRQAGVIVREHECLSRDAAEVALELLVAQVRRAVEGLGGAIDSVAKDLPPPGL